MWLDVLILISSSLTAAQIVCDNNNPSSRVDCHQEAGREFSFTNQYKIHIMLMVKMIQGAGKIHGTNNAFLSTYTPYLYGTIVHSAF